MTTKPLRQLLIDYSQHDQDQSAQIKQYKMSISHVQDCIGLCLKSDDYDSDNDDEFEENTITIDGYNVFEVLVVLFDYMESRWISILYEILNEPFRLAHLYNGNNTNEFHANFKSRIIHWFKIDVNINLSKNTYVLK